MSSVQQPLSPRTFVPHVVQPLIRSFLEKTTAERWRGFRSSSADDATKILVAELILEMIAALSAFILTSPKAKTEERLMAELEESLPQTLSEALGIPDQVDNLRLKTLTSIIYEEVKYNLVGGGKAGVTKHLTPVARLNAMNDQLLHLFQKFFEQIETLAVPRPRKSPGEAGAAARVPSKVSLTSPTSQVIKQEINNELRDIINPLLEDIPDSEELQRELSSEIQKVADEAVCTVCGMRSKKTNAFKNIRKRMKSVLTKSFAKVCLMRILDHLKKKHSQETTAINQSAEMILSSLTSQFADGKSPNVDTEDSFLLMFRHLRGDKVLVFGQELSKLIYRHGLAEPLPRSSSEESFAQQVHADIRSKTWIFMVLMNWFLTTHVNSVTDRLTLPLMDKSASRMLEFSKTSISGIEKVLKEEQRSKKNKKYVQFVIEKVVFTVCSDANMVPETRDELIENLTETVWSNVHEEQFYIHAEVFRNIEKEIRRSLYKNLSSPENVLFLITHEDPVIVDRIMLVINKKLLWPRKDRNAAGIFPSLGSTMSKMFKRPSAWSWQP